MDDDQAEYKRLLRLYFALQPASPGLCCFCGSLDDLRQAVADLQAQHEKEFSA